MSNWVTKQISELADVVSGGTPSRDVPDYWGADYFWVTPTDITGTRGLYLHESKEKISELGLKKSSTKLLPPGSILMTSRATLGESKIATVPVCTNQGFKSLVVRDSVCNVFLRYLLLQNKSRYSNFGIGTTFLEVNKVDTDRFQVHLPELKAEQEKIAEILTVIDDQIESTERLIEKKVSLRSGTLVNFFSQQSEELLGNIANVTMGQSPSSTTVSDNLEDGLPFLQGCTEFTRVHPKPLKSCFGEGKRASSKSVLISVRAPVGDTNIADREYVIGRGLAAIFPKVGIAPDYLAFAIEFSKQKLNRVAQGSTFEAVGSQDIFGLRINFHPDPSERNKVSSILSSISGDIENNISLLEKLKLQKQGLMQDLLTGRVRVN